MAAQRAMLGDRPPSFVSKATLAAELDICESTVDNLVQRGELPKPVRRGGIVRWKWEDVVTAMSPAPRREIDPFMKGVENVA